MGLALGRELGLNDEKIDAVAQWKAATGTASDKLSDIEKLVLEYTETLSVTPVSTDDDLRQRLQQQFSKKQLVELTHSIAWENARARFNRGFDLQPDGYDLDTD